MDEVRRLRRQLHATWAVIGVGVLVAAVPRGDDEIKARRFVVVDERGVERASFGTDSRGETAIHFDGQKDGHAITLKTNRAGSPSLAMGVPGGGMGLFANWTTAGKALFYVSDGDGTERIYVDDARPARAAEGVPAGALPRPRR